MPPCYLKGMTRYGPYRNNCGYWFWIDYDGVHRKTVLVSREVLATKLGRQLLPEEHAHHIDGDRDNNDPINLEVRDGREHNLSHARAAWQAMTPKERRRWILSGSRTLHRRSMDRNRKRAARERAKLASGAVAER